jgi:hypothetical protein
MIKIILIILGLAMTLPTIILWLLPALGFFLLGKLFKSQLLRKYGLNLAISLDQLANVLLLGDCDETISSRIGRALRSGNPKWWVKPFGTSVDWLAWTFFKDPDHCERAIEEEIPLNYEIWNWIKEGK